jgi:two-component system, sensor histidine kinase and response regulator
MQKTKHASQGHRVDMPELLSRIDNDRELLRDLLVIFKEEFPRHLQALRAAVERQNAKESKMVSHTLKGMLANLAVTKAAALAGHLEQLAGSEAGSSLTEGLAEFEREVDGLLAEMETYMEEVKS